MLIFFNHVNKILQKRFFALKLFLKSFNNGQQFYLKNAAILVLQLMKTKKKFKLEAFFVKIKRFKFIRKFHKKCI